MPTKKLNTSPSPREPHPVPNAERLQEIKLTDTAAGRNIQGCPAAWHHRRDLLAYIEFHEPHRANLEEVSRLTHRLCTGDGDAHEIQARIVRVIGRLFCKHGNWSNGCTHPDCMESDS